MNLLRPQGIHKVSESVIDMNDGCVWKKVIRRKEEKRCVCGCVFV